MSSNVEIDIFSLEMLGIVLAAGNGELKRFEGFYIRLLPEW